VSYTWQPQCEFNLVQTCSAVSDAVILKTLSYQEAWEMVSCIVLSKVLKLIVSIKLRRLTFKQHLAQSYFGANVLHPRTISPVIRYGIPIIIRNIFNLSSSGTMICHPSVIGDEDRLMVKKYVKGFATIDNLALVNVEG